MAYQRVSPGIYRDTQTGRTMKSPTMPQQAPQGAQPMPRPTGGQKPGLAAQVMPYKPISYTPQAQPGSTTWPGLIPTAIDGLKGNPNAGYGPSPFKPGMPPGYGAGIDPGFNMGPGAGMPNVGKPISIQPYPYPGQIGMPGQIKPMPGQPQMSPGLQGEEQYIPSNAPMSQWKY